MAKGFDLDEISKNNLNEVRNFDWSKLKNIDLKTKYMRIKQAKLDMLKNSGFVLAVNESKLPLAREMLNEPFTKSWSNWVQEIVPTLINFKFNYCL